MQLRTWLTGTLAGLIASILLVSGAASIATGDLSGRIATLEKAATIARYLDGIERARRKHEASGSTDSLMETHSLIADASDEISKLKAMGSDRGDLAALTQNLESSFTRYQRLLDVYARSEERENEARATMSTQLSRLRSMATHLKQEKESDYHRSFAAATSIKDVEDQLKNALRLKAFANEIIVTQMSIERAVALFDAGDHDGAADITLEIGRIAEIAERIRRIEEVAARGNQATAADNLPDLLITHTNQFQAGYDDFRLATLDQSRRAEEMADVAVEVTQLIQNVNRLQTEAAVRSSDRTLTLSVLGVATALLLGSAAALVFRNRIILPLSAITETTRLMSTGQLALAVPGHERSDELGAIAKALEVFRQSSLEARRLAREKVEVERRLARETAEARFLEQSLEREKELNAQQRRFVSLVSHEFRTPLAIIDGQAQRLIRRGDRTTADQRAAALGKVRGAVSRLTDLMESVLSSASLEAGSIAFDPVPTDLRTLLADACESQQEISKHHTINIDIDALPEDFVGDPKLLRQVVANLLSNAVKYSPNADHVDVTARATGDSYEIVVRDFGVGIPQDEIPKLFQRFFRASTSVGIQGTGIGLNLVKAFVGMHGGQLKCTSVPDEGTTFTVSLPFRHEHPPAIEEQTAPEGRRECQRVTA